MLQDIAPHVYDNQMCFDPASRDDYALCCSKEGVLLKKEEGSLSLPRIRQCRGGAPWTHAFSIDGQRFYLSGSPAEAEGFAPMNAYREKGEGYLPFACAVAQSLARWYGDNRFCGTCGNSMEHSGKERAMVCPKCGRTVYPKICPGVIVAVCDGDRLLLTKYAGRAFRRYALIAGFCEIGETVEETVHREVLEETGLRVTNLRFYKSQPWVVSDTLLMGFFADLDGSDRVKLQEDELSEGTWFAREEIPTDYSPDSLTGEMISLFRNGGEPCGALT